MLFGFALRTSSSISLSTRLPFLFLTIFVLPFSITEFRDVPADMHNGTNVVKKQETQPTALDALQAACAAREALAVKARALGARIHTLQAVVEKGVHIDLSAPQQSRVRKLASWALNGFATPLDVMEEDRAIKAAEAEKHAPSLLVRQQMPGSKS